MKQRSASTSSSRNRGGLSTSRARSTRPATSRGSKRNARKPAAFGRTKRSAKITTSHDEIREWVEAHGGHPAIVKRTTGGKGGGVLRIDFPGFSGEQSLKSVSWDEWFRVFDERKLGFLYQSGEATPQSRFNKLVNRSGAKKQSGTKKRSRR